MTKEVWVTLVVATLATGILAVLIMVSRDAIQTKRDWIDQCVIQEWESTGERHVGVMDYCVVKYRQMRG